VQAVIAHHLGHAQSIVAEDPRAPASLRHPMLRRAHRRDTPRA
jgi:hypothetical protein